VKQVVRLQLPHIHPQVCRACAIQIRVDDSHSNTSVQPDLYSAEMFAASSA
jgi:hypothetical protein